LSSSLKRHYKTAHLSNVKDYPLLKCCDCLKVFQLLSSLKRHYKTAHQSNFDYHCAYCGKGFRDKSMLRSHTSSKHGGQKDFSCSICGKQFSYKYACNRHMSMEHGSHSVQCRRKWIASSNWWFSSSSFSHLFLFQTFITKNLCMLLGMIKILIFRKIDSINCPFINKSKRFKMKPISRLVFKLF